MDRRVGWPAVVMAAGGGVLVVLAYTVMDWLPQQSVAPAKANGYVASYRRATFYDLDTARHGLPVPTLAQDFVTWLGWALLVLAVTAGLGAAVATTRTTAWRIAAVVAGLLAVAVMARALALLTTTYPASDTLGDLAGEGLGDAYSGAWLAVAGFGLCALAGAIGPWTARDRVDRKSRSARLWWGRTARRWQPDRRVAVSGALAVLGLLVSLGALDLFSWYHQSSDPDAASDVGFSDLGRNFVFGNSSRLVHAYFPLLAWVLALAPLPLIAAANLRSPLAPLTRVGAGLTAAASFVLTYLALQQAFSVNGGPAGSSGVFSGMRVGLVAAFLAPVLYLAAVAWARPAAPGDAGPDTMRE